MADIGNAFQGREAGSSVSSLAIEASVGAIWEILRKEVSLGRAKQAPRLAAIFTFLILTPATGSFAAIDAICPEEPFQASAESTLTAHSGQE